MKWLSIICLFTTLSLNQCNCSERSQRLILPTTASLLRIIPRVEMPTIASNSIQSGFSLKMPISIQFPSMVDMFQSVRNTMNGNNNNGLNGNNNGLNGNNIGLNGNNNGPQRFPSSANLPHLLSVESDNTNKSRVNSRAQFYRTIEKSHNSFGRVCLMRAICEVAEVPLISSSTGLIGEIIDLLLTTSLLKDETGLLTIYRDAERIGKEGFGKEDTCKYRFKECPLSIFNIVDLPFNG